MSFVTLLPQILTPQWLHGESTLKVFASSAFYEYTTGQYVGEGNIQDVNSFCQSLPCTLNGTTLTLPQITLATTTDSSVPTALMTAGIFDSNNVLRYPMLSQFFVDPEYFQSPAESSVLVEGAGSTIVNGNYTYRGEHNNRPYYNLAGQADSTSLYAIYWTGSQWRISNSAGTTMYTGTDVDYPWETVWSVGGGALPAPNVNENQEIVVATWEQLTSSNQGTGTVYPFGLPGPFWNVPQIKEYVNSLVGDGTTPFMSTLVAGKGAIDTAPDISTFPITVGINSPRLTKILSVDYNNDLAAAVADIGAIPTTLIIKEDADMEGATIPATLYLEFQQGAVLNYVSGVLEFEGIGIWNAYSTVPFFADFPAEKLIWTGVRPAVLSTEIVDTGNDSLSERVEILDAAFTAKVPTLKCYPRTITKSINVSNFSNIHFTAGDYLNTRDDNIALWSFQLASNTWVTGANATLYESTENAGCGAQFGVLNGDNLGAYENIYVKDLIFKDAVGATGSNASTVALGNCTNGGIFNCVFDGTHHYNQLGAIGTSGNYAQNLAIQGCVFKNVNTQAAAIVNGINCRISNNTFYYPVVEAPTFSAIDVEPNVDLDIVENCVIEGNTIYMPNDNSFAAVSYVIAATAALNGSIKNLTIRNNTVIGQPAIPVPANLSPVAAGISIVGVSNYQIYDNYIQSAYQIGAITIRSSRFGQVYNNTGFQCSSASGLYGGIALLGVANTDVYSNAFNASDYPPVLAGQYTNIYEAEEDITVTTSGTTVTNTYGNQHRLYDLMVGLNVLINTATYTVNSYTSQFVMGVSSALPTMTQKTFTNANVTTGTGNIAITAHGYLTGGALYLTGADVPGNLTSGRTYYAIRVDDDNLKLADTLALADAGTAITFSDAGTGTNTITPIMQTRFSSNRYWGNKAPQGITLESTGSSLIWSDAEREISDDISPAQITSDQNNYNPGRNAYRINITTDAARTITGLTFTNPPPLNGERHEIYYQGTGGLTLPDQDALSSAANRFANTTSADIVMQDGDLAYLEYNGSQWIVWSSAIAAAQLPTGIDATKIADGSVSNTEFQYIGTLTSNAQTQLDAKAPLVSPSFTTPNIGAASGTSLNVSGALIGASLNLGGVTVTDVLSATASLNFDLTGVDYQDLTITVTGAAVGDTVMLGIPNGAVGNAMTWTAWVSAADTVTVRALAVSGTPDPAAGTFRATILKI